MENYAQNFLGGTILLIACFYFAAGLFNALPYFTWYWTVIPLVTGFYYVIKAIQEKKER